MHTLKRVLSRPVLYSIAAGLLVGVVVLMIAMNRPTEFTARVGLLASPTAVKPDTTTADFSGVVSQSMPAIVEVAHSPSVLAAASAAVPGAPSPRELFDAVSLAVEPGSGLARLTVTASSADVASGVADAISNQLSGKDFFGQAGTLRILDASPDVREVEPNTALAGGLALAAGAAVGLAIFGAGLLLRPSTRRRLENALGSAGFSRPVAIVDGDPDEVLARVGLLSTASGRPVRVVALTESAERDAEKLELELSVAGVKIADGTADENVPVVGAADSTGDSAGLRATVSALPPGTHLLAVVLS